jgi:ATP-dependent Clp protease adapter protein ClpS
MMCIRLSKLCRQGAASDFLKNCSECLIHVFKEGSSVVWICHKEVRKTKNIFEVPRKSASAKNSEVVCK